MPPSASARANAHPPPGHVPGVDDPGVDELLRAAARGDQRAWADLVTLYARRLFALARSRLRDDDAAEEIVQSVFVTVAEHVGRGTYDDRGKFEAWLFRVGTNRIRDEIRRRRRRATRFAADPRAGAIGGTAPALEQVTAADEPLGFEAPPLAALRSALEELPPADRDVIELRHHGGLSFNQIADLLDEPVGTLLARHHRALRKLRKIIESRDPTQSDRSNAREAQKDPAP